MNMSTGQTEEMRKAVAAGDWPAVLRLWEAYNGGILEEIQQRTCTPARLAEARVFLDWARRVALCSRAQTQQRLNAIHAVREYSPQPERPRSTVRISF